MYKLKSFFCYDQHASKPISNDAIARRVPYDRTSNPTPHTIAENANSLLIHGH